MRTIIVGDIHGCYQELMLLLAKAQLTDEDRLISLGDIVDRGPDSVQVYDFLRHRPNTIVLMGNHERKHLRQILSYSQDIVKLQFGDSARARSERNRYPEFLDWVSQLPYYVETDQAILVHAAMENGIPIESQRAEVLCGCTAGEKYLEKQYGSTYWSQIYSDTKPVIFGHHVVGDEPLIVRQTVYGIDTGACHGGRLTGLILPNFEIVQVQSAQDYWRAEMLKWQLPVMRAKPWSSYKWEKIQAICHEYRDSNNSELVAFIAQQEQWINDLWAMAPLAILKIQEKLAEAIAQHGADGFKKQVKGLSYDTLLYQENSSSLTPEFLQKTLSTPDKWLQVMTDLDIHR